MATYLRFVIPGKDEDSGKRQGLIQTAVALRELGRLTLHEQDQVKGILDWFNKNLEVPRRLSKSRKQDAKAVAISWFRDTAITHIAKMRELASLLEAHGIKTEMIRTERPGYIVYEDEHQVTALPFRDTGA